MGSVTHGVKKHSYRVMIVKPEGDRELGKPMRM